MEVFTRAQKNGSRMDLSRSANLFQIAREFAPGGTHSNIRWREPHPIYFRKALGAKIWDVDGNEYLDCVGNLGALILGHADPDVIEAVKEQLNTGITVGVETELNVEVAKKFAKMVPCAEMVRFSTSGTEAVMNAIRLARAYTQKERIVKAEGNYHGSYDYVLCSHRYPKEDWQCPRPVPASEGLCKDLLRSTLVVPWNNLEKMEEVIHAHKDDIAAVIIEPINYNVGCALPKRGYLEGVRELTEKNKILLIFDEIISGFRVAPGGAQEFYHITPDLATFGKAMANGFPLSALAGKRKIIEFTDPSLRKVFFGGTYNANQVAMAAASVCLEKLKTGEVQKYLARLTEKLVRGFKAIAARREINARLQGFGGKFQVYFTSQEVEDLRSASTSDQGMYTEFHKGMQAEGIFWGHTPFSHNGITAAHTEEDIEKILKSSDETLGTMRKNMKG